MGTLEEEQAKDRKQRNKKLKQLAVMYEDSMEIALVVLARKLEENIAASNVPLTHVNLVLDMLKQKCLEMSIDAYVTRGHEKLAKIENKDKKNG